MWLLVSVALAPWHASLAQGPAPIPLSQATPATVAGRVVTPGPTREIGIPNVVVTLHRVGPDSAGPLDSTRTDGAGRYTMRYARFGSADALYFAAAIYHGIAYFSAPLRSARANADDAEITVFDTTSRPVPLTIQGHHIVVGAARPDGLRDIVEVYELSNDTTVTVVGRDSLAVVWSAPLPRGATSFVGGQGDVAPVSLARRGDRVVLLAPFGPGVKQLSYSYALGERAFPLRFALERQTVVLEVLLEEPGAQARAASLRAQGTATTQGRTFKRFLAQGAPAGEELRIDVPAAAAGARARALVGLVAGIAFTMALTLTVALRRRAPAKAQAPARVESLVAAIAALDARHDAGDATLSESRYLADRADLRSALAAVVAGADDAT